MQTIATGTKGDWLSHPSQLGTLFAEQWRKVWTKVTHEPPEELALSLSHLYTLAQAQPLPPLTTNQVRSAIKGLKNDTAVGIDWWKPTMLKQLQPDALEKLTQLLQSIEDQVAWPEYILANIITLMGKPTRGNQAHSPYAHVI